MYMKNVEETLQAHGKKNLKVDLGKCEQMYRAPFLYFLGPPIH